LNELLPIIVFGPLLGGFILLFLPRALRYVSAVLTLLVTALVFVGAFYIFRIKSLAWSIAVFQLQHISFDLLLKSSPLSAFIILFTAGFAFLVAVYSIKSFVDNRASNIYFGAILLTAGASIGVLLSDHLLALLFFWEIVTVALYLLITTGRENSNYAATKTFAMLGTSDGALLVGILFLYKICGTFQISQINLTESSALTVVAFLLMLTAAVTKAGALPLHTWLPTSGQYSDASVMAILPASIDKLLGIYLLVMLVMPGRGIFSVIASDMKLILAVIGAATVLIAVMIAMVQHNIKKLFAYHAISQVGYMFLGIATMNPIGFAGGLFHMLNHSIYKSCLFLCAGAVEQSSGTAELEKLGGLGRKMPLTFTACLIASLSISGVLPFNGFASKWLVYQGIIQMGSGTGTAAALWPLWLVIAMFASALTLASFVKIIHSVFLSRLPDELKGTKEVSAFQYLPMLILAALCVIFGVAYMLPLKAFIYPALGLEDKVQFIGWWDSPVATFLLIAGLLVGLVIIAAAGIGKKARMVRTWTGGEIQPNDSMIIPGTGFYKTVSSLGGLKRLYFWQENEVFDPYAQAGRGGLSLTALLRWLHNGVLPMYMTWVTLGLLVLLFVLCRVW
jgi:formate hydrogenlyase subunit 3/multisubunit Na+/H+ antiporter MnhD subunit